MAKLLARNARNKILVVDDEDTSDIVRLHNKGFTFYTITPAGGGSFTLTPQRIASGTEVTQTVTTALELEDDI